MNNATANLLYDKRFVKKNGKCPVKLTVYFDGQKQRYNINFNFTEDEWEKINQSNLRDDTLKKSKALLFSVLDKANKAIESMQVFSFNEFEQIFFEIKQDKKDLFIVFQSYIDLLKAQNRIGTANSYNNALTAFKSFLGKTKCNFIDLNPALLNEFERKWLEKGKSITTVGIYMRSLRTIFNLAKSENVITEKDYPFGKHKYVIPAGANIKKAFSKDVISKIYNYKAVKMSQEHFARDMWVFSYLCNGINFRDIAKLKYQDVKEDSIFFIRQKTSQTTRAKQKLISAVLLPELKNIIITWGNKPIVPEQYVFPVLNDNMTIEKEVDKVKQTIKTINKYLRRIAATLELGVDITTYTARHSFATQLKSTGASTEFISESLGHSSLAVTENYLASFPQEEKKKWASKLTDFK